MTEIVCSLWFTLICTEPGIFYRQIICLSVSTTQRIIPGIFLCIMSVNKFFTGFHVHVFYKIPAVTDNFYFEKCFHKLLIIQYRLPAEPAVKLGTPSPSLINTGSNVKHISVLCSFL